jgi:hypothetical protein
MIAAEIAFARRQAAIPRSKSKLPAGEGNAGG